VRKSGETLSKTSGHCKAGPGGSGVSPRFHRPLNLKHVHVRMADGSEKRLPTTLLARAQFFENSHAFDLRPQP
jgi:hypothetical protein